MAKLVQALRQQLKHTSLAAGALAQQPDAKTEQLINLAVQTEALRHGLSVAETGDLGCHLLNFVEGV